MNIQEIQIQGYKNISSVSLCLYELTALIGLNGSGKSNIIEAIDFGIDFIQATNSDKTKMMGLKSNIPILKVNVGMDYSFLIKSLFEKKNESYLVEYTFSFSWAKNKTAPKITAEQLRIKKIEKGQKYNSLITRDGTHAFYKSAETGRCDHAIFITDNALVLNKLLAIDDLFYKDIIKSLNEIEFYIDKHLDASPSYRPNPFILKDVEVLDPYGSTSIPRLIYELKKNYPQYYDRLSNAFMQLFPDITSINVNETNLDQASLSNISFPDSLPIMYSDSIYTMSVIDKRMVQPLLFEKLSDGTKRIFLMFTYAIIADIKGISLIAIEEPENTIHPRLLQSFLSIITQLVNNCKIIITSHSPYMLQFIHPSCLYVGMPNNEGSSEFRSIARINALIKDASEFDVSVGDYLFGLLASRDAEEALLEYVEK